jgi:outer membrane receptor for ferrienterochelin and colicins
MRFFTSTPCALFCLIALHAIAEEAVIDLAEPKGAVQKVQRVEVRGVKDIDDRRESTAAKTVILGADIVRYGDTSLADVLKRLPGISVRGVQGRGGEIRMRGLGSGYTQILLNGDRAPPGFSLDSLSPELIERIEIARAATADVSAQAIAGSINIILKKKIETARRDIKLAVSDTEGQPALSWDGLFADHDGAFSYTVAGGVGQDKGNYLSRLDQLEFDNLGVLRLQRSTDKQDDSQSERFNLAPRLMWALDGGDSLNWESLLRFQRSTGSSHESRQTALGGLPQLVRNDSVLDADSSQIRSKLGWLHKLESGAKLDIKLGVADHRSNAESRLDGFDIHAQPVLNRRITTEVVDQGLSLNGKYSNGYIEGHTFALGWDGEYSQRSEDNIQREITQTIPAHNLDETYLAKVGRIAVFAQDEWEISPLWSAYLGLRWEGIRTQSMGQEAFENRSGVLSPVLHTLWKISEKDQLRFALSRTYKAPTTRDLTPRRVVANDNSATTPDIQGNPNLRPELAWGADLAFEHYLSEGGVLSASSYTRQIDDVILSALSETNGVWLSQRSNQGRAELFGVELEAKFNLRQYIAEAPALDVRANISANWSKVESAPGPDNRVDQQTPLSANLGIDYKTGALTTGGNFNFQSASTTRLSQTQTIKSPAKRTLDLYGLWKFNPAVQLRISLANLLAEDHIAESYYADLNGLREQFTTSPTSRTVRALLEMKL